MLTRGDTVKILDFGIARILGDPRATDHGSVVGTPAYMSPEQLRDEPLDQRTDIWSLGAVLYEMLTGEPPFPGDTVAAVVASILSVPPPRASGARTGVPNRADEILAKALVKDRRLRYERMEDMARDLLDLRSALDSGAIIAAPARGHGGVVHRGSAVRGHEPAAGPAVPLRRHRRGDPARARPHSRALRRLAHLGVPIQEPGGRRARDRRSPERRHGARGERSPLWRPRANLGPARERRQRLPPSGTSGTTAK